MSSSQKPRKAAFDMIPTLLMKNLKVEALSDSRTPRQLVVKVGLGLHPLSSSTLPWIFLQLFLTEVRRLLCEHSSFIFLAKDVPESRLGRTEWQGQDCMFHGRKGAFVKKWSPHSCPICILMNLTSSREVVEFREKSQLYSQTPWVQIPALPHISARSS